QSDGAGVGGAESGPATFPDPGGRSREAQRTGFSPWKRSFCSSGQDRNGTVSCRGPCGALSSVRVPSTVHQTFRPKGVKSQGFGDSVPDSINALLLFVAPFMTVT